VDLERAAVRLCQRLECSLVAGARLFDEPSRALDFGRGDRHTGELSLMEVEMPTLHYEIRIDAPAAAVWAVLGDLASTPEWIPGVVEASVDDGRRVCRTADGQEIREQIVDYSEEGRSWGYEQSQVPLPITGSHGTVQVHDEGDGARVAWEARFEVVDPAKEGQLVPMIEGYYKQTLESLRNRVEGGRPSS
jgi:uncharacterized protein YndB with AHSA1/START domain